MSIIFFRAVILLITLLVVMRLMGKRQIGEMEPYEFIITLVIAELICVPMSDVSIPLLYGIVSVLAIFILHRILTILDSSCRLMRKIISGKPAVVVNENGINLKELKRNDLSVDDLLEALRGTGNFSFDDVKCAVFESNGKLSVLKNENVKTEGLPLLLVAEGKIIKNNLKFLKKDEEFLRKTLSENGVNDLKSVVAMTVEPNGKIYLQERSSSYRIIRSVELTEEKW